MPDILTLSLTHGRRSFSVLHDPARLPSVYAKLNDGEFRPGMLEEVEALAEIHPRATLDELLTRWRARQNECQCFGDTGLHASTHVPMGSDRLHCDLCGKPVPDESTDVLTALNEPAPANGPTVPLSAAASAILLVIDHLARDPRDDLPAMVVALNEAGFGEVAREMMGRAV